MRMYVEDYPGVHRIHLQWLIFHPRANPGPIAEVRHLDHGYDSATPGERFAFGWCVR